MSQAPHVASTISSTSRTRPTVDQQASWTAHRERRVILDKIIASPRVGIEQWWNSQEVQASFADVDDVLRALHGRWSTLVLGSLDSELDTTNSRTPQAALRVAYQRAVSHSPKLRQVLDECSGYDVVRLLTRREHLALARVSGVWPAGASAAEADQAVIDLVGPLRRVATPRVSRRERRERAREVVRLKRQAEMRGDLHGVRI